MADNVFSKLAESLKNIPKFTDKISEMTKSLDKIAGGLGTAIGSNFDPEVVKGKIGEVDKAASKLVGIFGQGREAILGLKAALTESVAEVTRLGGSFQDIVTIQEDIAKATQRSLIVDSSLYEKLYATTQVTGKGADELTTAFKDVGFSISHILDQMQSVVDNSRAIGVSARAVSSQVVANMDYMNRMNFQGGVEGMAKMPAQAVNLRISMKDTLSMAERMFSPESAIEMSAALQRLGVTQSELLDPLRLMDLSMNDPTELQNQIAEMTKSFVQLNEKGQFEIMPGGKLQLMEIARAMQIPYDTLTKMALGGAELEEKMSRIRFPSANEFADEDTRSMIANMAEFNKKTGEFEVTFATKDGEKVTKSVTQLAPEDIEQLKLAGEPKEMIKLAEEQLDVSKRIAKAIESLSGRTGYAYAGTDMSEKLLAAQVEIFDKFTKNVSDKFDIKNLRQQFNETGKVLSTSLETGDFEPMKKAFKELQSHFVSGITETVSEKWPETIKILEKSTNEYVRFVAKMGFDLEKILEKLKVGIPDEDEPPLPTPFPKPPLPKPFPKPPLPKPFPEPIPGQDLVSYPNSGNRLLTGEFGSFSLDKRDMVVAGDPNKLMGNPSMDNLSMMESFMNSQRDISTTSSINQNIKAEGEVSFVIKVDSNNPNITAEQMERILEDRGIMDSIRRKLDEISTNIGRTSPVNPVEYNKNIVNQQYSNTIS